MGAVLGGVSGQAVGLAVFGSGDRFASGGGTYGDAARAYLAAQAKQALAVHSNQDDTVWDGGRTILGVHGISAGKPSELPRCGGLFVPFTCVASGAAPPAHCACACAGPGRAWGGSVVKVPELVGAGYSGFGGKRELGDHLTGRPRGRPHKHNGGAPAGSGAFRQVVCRPSCAFVVSHPPGDAGEPHVPVPFLWSIVVRLARCILRGAALMSSMLRLVD